VSLGDDSPSLWRNRDFTLLWSSQTLSDIGSTTSLVAVPLLVLSLGGSATAAGAVGTSAAVAQALLRLPGGALADRWNRRALMLASDAIRFVMLGVLSVALLAHHAPISLVAVLITLSAVADVVSSPAEAAAISRLVPETQLATAFARNEARSAAASLIGPPLGGLLFGIRRVAPFLVDAVTFLVSFVAVALIRTPFQGDRSQRGRTSIVADIREGLSYVGHSRFLRVVLLIAAPVNFAITGALFAVTVLLRQHGTPPGQIGLALGVVSVGGLLGAIVAPWLQARATLRALVIAAMWAIAGSLAAASLLTPHLLTVAPLAIGLFLAPAVNSSLFGRLAGTTPEQLQGRVISVIFFAATGTASLAPITAGILIEHVNGTAALLGCAIATSISAVVASLSNELGDTPESVTP
jgi:MFS family permease